MGHSGATDVKPMGAFMDPAHAPVRQRIENEFGRTTSWVQPDTGLTAAARYSVTLADGSRIFVKAATDAETEDWLRTEHIALQHVPERFVPRILAWLEEPDARPILVVEDLSHAHWPAGHDGVNWRAGDIEKVLAAVSDLSGLPAPQQLPPSLPRPPLWPEFLGTDRDAFLGLGLCTHAWLAGAAPLLVDAEAALDDRGDRIVHGDLRSDNICIDGDRAVFVDWSDAARGHAEHDLAVLLPTLRLEGGPAPYDVMPAGAGWAAAGCATSARRVLNGSAMPQWLSDVITRIAAIDLVWAAACLDLPQPDGATRPSP